MSEDLRTRCWFRIRAVQPDPASITELLNLQPTTAWRAGERPPHGGLVSATAVWEIESPIVNSVHLEDMATAVLDLLPAVLPDLAAVHGWTTTLAYTVWMRRQTPGMLFRPGTLARLARLGASLDIDTYLGTD